MPQLVAAEGRAVPHECLVERQTDARTACVRSTIMTSPDHDPSVDREPQDTDQPARSSTSGNRADQSSQKRDNIAPNPDPDLVKHSVFDEPDIFPGREAEVIDQDWSCGNCGYNLRGLPTGHRCPECGHHELYRPPPAGEPSYGQWYRERKANTTPTRSWVVLFVAAAAAWPWAVLGKLLTTVPTLTMTAIIAPAVEETMKIVVLALLIEVRPHLIRNSTQIYVAAVAGALGLAALKNIMYLSGSGQGIQLLLWRWIACTGLHVALSVIAVRGLAKTWVKADHEARSPQTSGAFGPLLLAILLHGIYNGYVAFLDAPDYAL